MKTLIAAIKKIVRTVEEAVEKASMQMASYQDGDLALCYYANRTMWY